MKNTKLLALVILLIAAAAALYSFWDIFMSFFVAVVIAYLLNPPAKYMAAKTKIPRGLSCVLVLFIFIIAAVLLVSIFVPFVINQVSALIGDLNSVARNYDNLVASIMEYVEQLPLPDSAKNMAYDFLSRSDAYLMSLFTTVLTALVNMSLGIFDLIVTIIITVYFMMDGADLARALLRRLPPDLRRRGGSMAREFDSLTRRYIKTRVLISLGTAVVTYIGLLLLGFHYAFLFAFITFVLDFIPYFGSLLAGAIEVVYALVTGGFGLAVPVLIFVLVVQQIQGNIVAPRVEGDATGLHPITVMFSLLACGRLFGPLGMLISTPIAAACKLVIKEIYRFIIEPEGYDPDQTEIEL